MTWSISVNGHDDLTGDAKEEYENAVVAKAQTLVNELAEREGGRISSASVSTNTTGSVDLLATEAPAA